MVDFSFTPEQEMLRKTAREFAEREVAPKLDWMDETGKVPMDVVKKMGELGLAGVIVPKEYGGTGMGHVARMIILEEIGRISAAMAMTLEIQHLGQSPIIYFATDDQKKRWLPALANGKKIAAYALTEPVGGSDVYGIKTTAKKEGDVYVLNGRKCFITNANICDLCGVVAKTGDKELGCFIIEKGTPGFKPGREEDKFGLRGCNTGEIVLDNCEVPEQNMIGKAGDGLRIALTCIDNVGRTGVGASASGIVLRCLEEAVKYANQRVAYSRPIAELQAIQWLISDMYMDYQASRWMMYYAAWLRDKGVRCDAENSLAKFWSTEAAVRCARKLIDIYGAYGVLKEYIPQRLLRDAQPLISAAGTSEIMRLLMARRALREYA